MMTAPRAIRLWTSARDPAPPKAPFGLASWSDDAEAIAVLLEGSTATLDDTGAVAAQIPNARTRPHASAVVVLGTAAASGSRLRRFLLPTASVRVARAPRCSALLARGYVDIGAGTDDHSGADLVWGFAAGEDAAS